MCDPNPAWLAAACSRRSLCGGCGVCSRPARLVAESSALGTEPTLRQDYRLQQTQRVSDEHAEHAKALATAASERRSLELQVTHTSTHKPAQARAWHIFACADGSPSFEHDQQSFEPL